MGARSEVHSGSGLLVEVRSEVHTLSGLLVKVMGGCENEYESRIDFPLRENIVPIAKPVSSR